MGSTTINVHAALLEALVWFLLLFYKKLFRFTGCTLSTSSPVPFHVADPTWNHWRVVQACAGELGALGPQWECPRPVSG